MPARQARDPLEQRPRADQAGERKDLVEADEIDPTLDRRVGEDRLDLRTEQEQAAGHGVVEGDDPEVVAGEEEPAPLGVPDREGELAVEMEDEVLAVLLVQVDQHLDVGVGAEDVAPLAERVAQLPVIEDLAVADQDDGAVLVVDRLIAG